MMYPGAAGAQLLIAMATGMALGAVYDFLRPLGRGRSLLRDGLFLLCLFRAAAWLAFGVCGGDLRLPVLLGAGLGGLGWEWSLGRFFRPLCRRFWSGMGRIRRAIVGTAKNFLKISLKNQKISFHPGKNGLQ